MIAERVVVLFDFDGTIADTAAGVWEAIAEAAAEFAVSVPSRLREHASVLQLSHERIGALLEPPLAPDQIPRFRRAVRRRYAEGLRRGALRCYPGICDILTDLRARGRRLGVVSRKDPGALRPAVERLGLSSSFDVVVGSSDADVAVCEGDVSELKRRKLLEIVGWWGVRARDAVYVGDAPGDAEAARSAGLASVGVAYGDFALSTLRAARPCRIAESVAELAAILGCGSSDAGTVEPSRVSAT